jgi:Flagellar hook-length control protein FliK
MLAGIHSQSPLLNVDQPLAPLRDLFQSGQSFWGRVLERLDDTTVTLLARGTVIRAQTSIPLAIGFRYQFLVQQTEPRMIFQVLNPESSPSVSLLRLWQSYAATRTSFTELLGSLAAAGTSSSITGAPEEALLHLYRILPTVVTKGGAGVEASWLATQLTSSGLFWEHKVARWLQGERADSPSNLERADLKGALLALKESLTTQGTNLARADLQARVNGALEFVELQQKLNLLLAAEQGPWVWVIPDMEGRGPAEIYVARDGEERTGSGGGSTFRLRLRLSPSRLGPLEAVLGLQQDTISCQLRVGDESLAQWIESFLPLLRSGLEASGYRISFLGCEAGTIEDPPPGLKAIAAASPSLFHLVV